MRKLIIIVCAMAILNGCATRMHGQQDLNGMTTDQKLDYLIKKNEELEHKERKIRHQVAMAKFFPHTFWGR